VTRSVRRRGEPDFFSAVDGVPVMFYRWNHWACLKLADRLRFLFERRAVLLIRRLYIGILLAGLALSGGDAHAGDYTISYAFDAGELNDAGTKHDCKYGQECLIKSDKLDLSISLDLYFPDRDGHERVSVDVYGGRSRVACCYFSDGADSLRFSLEGPFVHLGVYEGRARRGNEFVRDEWLGILYLQFSDINEAVHGRQGQIRQPSTRS
jgi:hypothetical protein